METLRILHTNDLHSHFEHFPKIGRYLKKAQADKSASEVYTFDAGDFMDRSHPLSDATEGQANIELMNKFNSFIDVRYFFTLEDFSPQIL